MTKKPVAALLPGNVVLPPARELSLWMRRRVAEKGLPESALHLTVTGVREGAPDKGGRWIVVTAVYPPEWGSPRAAFTFKARPEKPWPVVG